VTLALIRSSSSISGSGSGGVGGVAMARTDIDSVLI